MQSFPCPYLNGEVELTDERQGHIAQTHPDLLPQHLQEIGRTLSDPDQIRRSVRMTAARLFYHRFEGLRGGKYVAVVVVSEAAPQVRHWIVTAYITRRTANGDLEWGRD